MGKELRMGRLALPVAAVLVLALVVPAMAEPPVVGNMRGQAVRDTSSNAIPIMRVDEVKFYGVSGGGAYRLMNHLTDTYQPSPEYVYDTGTNAPAYYIRNTTISIEAKFKNISNFNLTSAVIWAETDVIDFGEQTVSFSGPYSGFVRFTATVPLPDYVAVHNLKFHWFYKNLNFKTTPPVEMWVAPTHEIFACWQEPKGAPNYTKPSRWTCQWCTGMDDSHSRKDICDAIIANEHLSGLHYGYAAWSVDDILDTGGGMCGGWYLMFQEFAGDQGIGPMVCQAKCYILKNDCAASPREKWDSIIVKNPGLNNPEPTWPYAWWYDTDSVYPCPVFISDTDPTDDISRVREKRYQFYAPSDGHCINFLNDGGVITLYDASFQIGPCDDTYASVPSGHHYDSQLHDFRVNYMNDAVDHMHGMIYYDSGIGDCPSGPRRMIDVMSWLIPDEALSWDTCSMHYQWY